MIEAVAESDDALFEKYLDGEALTEAEIMKLRAGIRKATLAQKIFPVICGSAFKNKGVQNLLDAVVDYLPSPLDVPAGPGHRSRRQAKRRSTRQADDNEPFSALVFKIMTDPFVGQLAFIRVYSGMLNYGRLGLQRRPRARRSASAACVKMHANKREEIKEICAGDIAAAVGLKTRYRPATRSATRTTPIMLESIDFPAPVISARHRAEDQGRPGKAGHGDRQAGAGRSDAHGARPTRRPARRFIAGMGELHLEIIVDRMKREFGVEANVGKPQVAYRETIRKPAEAEGTVHAPDRRPRPVRPRQAPRRAAASRATGFEFDNEIVGGIDSEGIHPGRSRRASRRRSKTAFWPAIPMSDVKVTLFDGAYHDVDSSEMAFKICRLDGVQGSVPQGQAGAARAGDEGRSGGSGRVHGRRERRPDSRRGRLEGMEIAGGTQIIKALVPLSEMFGYATDCARARRAAAAFTMHFGRYEEVPRSVARRDRQPGAGQGNELRPRSSKRIERLTREEIRQGHGEREI